MKNRKTYFIWFDRCISILTFIWLAISLFTVLSIYTAAIEPLIAELSAFQSDKYIYFIAIFVLSTTRFTIKNNNLKRWYIDKKIDLSKITGITYDKNLHFTYINKKQKEKKFTMYLIGLRNNREKYASLINDIIEIVNSEEPIIEQTADEILESIYSARIEKLQSNDSKPLKVRGWLLVWKVYILYSIVTQGRKAFYMMLDFNVFADSQGWERFNLFYNGIAVFSLIILCIYICIFVASMFKRKRAVKAIITLYLARAIVLTLSISFMIYAFGPLYEPSVFVIFMLIIGNFSASLFDSLLVIRYFTQSIRVENTYIK